MKKYNKISKNKKGFTIVELMIATVIFSMIMLICLTAMVQVSRAYYKGITHSKTQEAARLLMDEISQNIQLSGSAISSLEPDPAFVGPEINVNDVDEATGVFCAGNKRYTYTIDRKVSSATNENEKEIKNAIISEDVKCSDTLVAGDLNAQVSGTTKSLIGDNMRLTRFSVSRVVPDPAVDIKSGNQLWRIDIAIAYGDQDLIDYTDDSGADRVTCKPGTGNEFCSIVELSKIVSRRIG